MHLTDELKEVLKPDDPRLADIQAVGDRDDEPIRNQLEIDGARIIFEKWLESILFEGHNLSKDTAEKLREGKLANAGGLRSESRRTANTEEAENEYKRRIAERRKQILDLSERFGAAARIAIDADLPIIYDFMHGKISVKVIEGVFDDINNYVTAINGYNQRMGYSIPETASDRIARTTILNNRDGEEIPPVNQDQLEELLRIYNETFAVIQGIIRTEFIVAGIKVHAGRHGTLANRAAGEIGYDAIEQLVSKVQRNLEAAHKNPDRLNEKGLQVSLETAFRQPITDFVQTHSEIITATAQEEIDYQKQKAEKDRETQEKSQENQRLAA